MLCKSHTPYTTRYNAKSGHEPKGRLPYASLEEAEGALGTGFWLEECAIQGSRRSPELADTCRGTDPGEVGAVSELQEVHAEGSGDAGTTLAFPVSPSELNTDRGGRISW